MLRCPSQLMQASLRNFSIIVGANTPNSFFTENRLVLSNTSKVLRTKYSSGIPLNVNCSPLFPLLTGTTEKIDHLPVKATSCVRCLHIDQTNFLISTNGSDKSSTLPSSMANELSALEYDQLAEETLESLTSYLDEIVENSSINDSDITYSSGVLTIKLGRYGTYVINKQTPNKQIWLSSPTSGPKRYDYIQNSWIYKHNGISMYELLNDEFRRILNNPNINFESHCYFGKFIE